MAKIVTFDFDDTPTLPHYDEEDDPHELSLIKSKGIKTIHIVHPLDK